jgi:hypothetical protein
MGKYLFLLIFISQSSFSVEPLKYIEGAWIGTYETDVDLGSTFVIKDGRLSLTGWDCKDNKISLIDFREIEVDGPASLNGQLDKYYEITVRVDFNSKSKGCPNNPDIFKFYQFSPNFESPLKITILKGPCAKYERALMEWRSFAGYYHRTDRGPMPFECER